ncbi:SET domain-containing protein 5 [Grifola frondosa]|uniref:SET domain-containing protein 5 n=1 Tax=Grifola frondosa TaxID=5627 RepID=A0A1C7LSN3_GRIFR|nr:SET domain-containing protein 5 [Grifola frondosa]
MHVERTIIAAHSNCSVQLHDVSQKQGLDGARTVIKDILATLSFYRIGEERNSLPSHVINIAIADRRWRQTRPNINLHYRNVTEVNFVPVSSLATALSPASRSLCLSKPTRPIVVVEVSNELLDIRLPLHPAFSLLDLPTMYMEHYNHTMLPRSPSRVGTAYNCPDEQTDVEVETETETENESTTSMGPSPEPSPKRFSKLTLDKNSAITASSRPVCVAPIPSKGGSGLLATRPITKGTLILSEPPLFTQPAAPARTNSTILNALAQRTRDEQRDFFALYNARKSSGPGQPALLPALGIFETNALPCDDDDSAVRRRGKSDRDGVFLLGARLNHSCAPNVARSWDSCARTMTFRALRDISAGEELCVNYVDVLGTRAQRAEELKGAFGFLCACEECASEGEALKESDRRRAAVRRLFEEVGMCGREPTLGMRKVKIALRLLKEENLVHYEASFCYDAFQFCVLVSDFTSAKAWARKAWEASCNTSGLESAASRAFKMYWANPRAHRFAGILPHMALSGPD